MTCCRPSDLCRLLPAALLLLTVSGCTPTDDKLASRRFLADYSAELELENSRLANQLVQVQTEKRELEQQLQHHKQLTTQLQLGLLKKHARVNELLQQNTEQSDDFVRSRSEVIYANNKVETVRLLAETTAVIETIEGDTLSEKSRDIKETAKDYLDEARHELRQDNYEKASYLAYQALDIISSMVVSSSADEETEVSEVSFALHLPMKTLKTCNIRAEPTMHSKILGIRNKGDIVSAAGFKRNWVKVKHGTSGHGWIHSSLLNTILK